MQFPVSTKDLLFEFNESTPSQRLSNETCRRNSFHESRRFIRWNMSRDRFRRGSRGFRLISRGCRARKTTLAWPGLAWLSRPFVLGRIYGFVRRRATMVSSRLTNVPRLNLKPPASRSLPVDYGPDKSFLENLLAAAPLYLSFPFVSALARHPLGARYPRRLFTGLVFSR